MIVTAILACALNVAPVTLEKIIHAESAGDPLALHVNGIAIEPPPAKTIQGAATLAQRFIAMGYSVDLGLMQVNSRNLSALGLTVQQVLDPCANVRAGARILTTDYVRASQQFGEGQAALLAALSAYNTGSFDRGFANGYVTRVAGGPALRIGATSARAIPPAPNPYTASTIAYRREDLHVRIN